MIRRFVLATMALACQAAVHAQAPAPPAPPGAGTTIAALSGKRCGSDADCVVTVKVNSVDPTKCKGEISGLGGGRLFDHVLIVAAGVNPNITWSLDASAIAGAVVSFDPTKGIDIDSNTSDDFDQANNAAPGTFKWRSVNRRFRVVAYDINLVVTPNGGAPYSCKLDDPIIINRGN